MKNTCIIICFVVCVGLAAVACKSQKQSVEGSYTPDSSLSPESLAEFNNQFAIDLFKQIHSNSDNLVYSPYSISTVLAMTYSGADGKTADQISEVLYFPPAVKSDPGFKLLNDKILSNDTMPGTEISLANAIWAQENFGFLPEYIQNIEKWYDAALTEMDFTKKDAREASRQRINNWVEENTRKKIKNLIGPGVLDANTRMVLTNAIYFNGKWMWPFDKSRTAPSIFHVSSQESLITDFMNQTRTLPYYEDEEIQALRLPYRNDRISMTIILPRKADGWKLASRVIDNEGLAQVESQFETTEVQLSLPKFSFELKLNLRKELTDMGMDLAFSREADFSGMNGEKNLYIDEVIHKAFIGVSENGTEAAAATAAIISLKSALREEPVRFNADHPFLYYIKDHQTGCIIFLGRLVKPS